MAAPAPDAPPPVFSGTELILAALNHASLPATCTKTTCTDRWGRTTVTRGTGAVWESEDLLRVAAVSKELRAAAAADHLWEPLLQRFMHQRPCGKNDHGKSTHPVYPLRIHGEKRDWRSLFPHAQDSEACDYVLALVLSWRRGQGSRLDEATGDVEDEFHPASEDPGTGCFNECPTTIWLKRPAPLLRCELCGGLSFECGRSFTEHCCGWKHCQLMLRPEQRLPEEL
ncbi:hypothetical protein FOA52_002422 [Chlamydomonas sp. UWO 241]|nr:hypothetical protein FOA52_002422 [Chlamydomonas sp. UWO 241]